MVWADDKIEIELTDPKNFAKLDFLRLGAIEYVKTVLDRLPAAEKFLPKGLTVGDRELGVMMLELLQRMDVAKFEWSAYILLCDGAITMPQANFEEMKSTITEIVGSKRKPGEILGWWNKARHTELQIMVMRLRMNALIESLGLREGNEIHSVLNPCANSCEPVVTERFREIGITQFIYARHEKQKAKK